MATFSADILSTLSRPSGDGDAQIVRKATPLNSIGSRRGFSSVLRTARGEGGRATLRKTDDARPANQTDNGIHAKATKGFTDSIGPERTHVSSQTTESARTGREDDTLSGETRAGLESSARQPDVGTGLQDHGPLPISSPLFVSTQPQVVDQTHIQIETEPHVNGDEAGLEGEARRLSISDEAHEPFETTPEVSQGRSFMKSAAAAVSLPSTQPSHPAESQAKDDGPGVQGAGQMTEEVVRDGDRVATDRGGSVPVSQDSTPRVRPSAQDLHAPLQVVQAHAGKTSSDEKGIVANDDAPNDEGKPVGYSVSSQVAGSVQSLDDQDGLGADTEQSFSHGRQPDMDGPEQFRELVSHHNGRQTETAEPTLSQPFVVDHAIATGSVAPGVSTQAIAVPGTPAPTSVVTQVQPGVPAEAMAQPVGVPGLRSVVVNVSQPDLGHVNVRIAMTSTVVHTQFSSERLEVGQFLINGQDRLQAALQASGLDLGQFRVDIDRQSGGRSFQQGPFQEQGRSWSRDSHGMGQEPHAERQGQTRGTRHGLLHVVA